MKHKRIINRVTAMVLAAAFVLSDAAILPNNVFAVSESAAQTSRVQAIEKDNDIIVNKSNDTAISTESVSSVQSGEKTESSSVADSSSLSETKKDDSTVIKVDSKPQPESKTESKAESKADVSSVKKSPKQLSKLSVPKRSAKTSISLFGAENSDAIGGDCSYSSSDSVAWSYDPLLKILTISGKGKMKDNCSSLWNTYEIENVIVEEGVTNIGSNAFSGCSKFTGEIKLPSTVTNIGERAFFNSKVTKVTCDDNIKSLYIGRMAFYGCSSMTDLHLSENLTSLSFSNSSDAYTFNGCSNLKELMIPGGIVNLNMSQFSTLSALEKITISEGITQISDGIFDGSKNSLKEVYLPSTLKTISNGLFEGYSKLEKINPTEDCNINIPEGVETVDSFAFNGCSNLSGKVMFPSTLKRINNNAFTSDNRITELIFNDKSTALYLGNNAFNGCASLSNIHFSNNLNALTYSNSSSNYIFSGCTNLKELNIPGGIGTIPTYLFYTIPALEKITVGEGITQINDGAFDSSASTLKEVYLPSTLTVIANGLFQNYSILEKINPTEDCNINIPEGVETIDSNAFYGCSSLSGKVIFPSTLKKINDNAFFANEKITDFIFNDESTELYLVYRAFGNCTLLSNIHFSDKLKNLTCSNSYYNNIFSGCTNLKELNIPGSIGTFATYLFNSAPALEKITVGEGITQINDGAFDSSASTLKEVYLPSTLTVIANGLFQNYSKLEKINPTEDCNINIPNGVETIDSNAFYGCSSLSGKVMFPSTLKNINSYAFQSDEKITDFIFNDESTELYLGYRAFCDCKSLSNIHFSDKLKELTCANSYYNSIFGGCTNLKELNIPGSIEKINQYTFNSAPALEKVTVGEGITQINDGAFDGSATTLKEVHIPSTLTVIANGLFQNYSKLERINPTEDYNINIPEGVQTIDSYAFQSCKSLVGKMKFPSTLRNINSYAFHDCTELTGDNGSLFTSDLKIENIGYYAFSGCTKLNGHLYLPDSLKTIDSYAFRDTNFTDVHTPLLPFCVNNYYGAITSNNLWFRGTDDTETVVINNTTYDWSSFMDKWTARADNPKLYIDSTAKHLTSKNFWKKFTDVNFIGPNVIRLERTENSKDKDIFSGTQDPLASLDGTYYVTEQGVLYLLDPVRKSAALAYCPAGITELDIPAGFTVPEGMAQESKYEGKYQVASVLSHSILMASDLTTVNAAQPKKIVLNSKAFADCPTLTKVNGVTTQKEANALFGPYGTLSIKSAFVNTGLTADSGETGGGEQTGRPMRYLTYTDPNTGRLKVTVKNINAGDLVYENGSYRLLTQDKVTFNLEAEAYGTEDIMTQFHIYFSPSDNIEGFKLGKETISYEYNGNQKTVVVTTTFDAMMGCYCFSFQLPGGVTWSQQDFLYSGSQIGYPGRTSRGGDLIVWGEVMPVVNNETDDTQMPELQGNTDYMKLNWSTLRNLYEMEMQDQTNEADVNQTTHKPYFRYNYRINDKLKYRDNKIINNNAYRGKDPVTKIIRRFTVTLPEGMVWDQDDVNSRCANGSYPGKVIEFSEDNRTLVYDYTSTYNDYAAGLGGETFGLYFNNNSVIITDTYDFYSESKIKYTCKGTVYYMYSDPDEMQEAEGYETLPALKGDIVFDRSCRQNGETGRAKPITNYLKVINKGAKNASADLKSITDRPVNDNGYTNLSSDQIIALFREKNEYLEIQNITVEKVLLYQDGKDFKLGTVHTGCDGVTAVEENRLNTYSDPTYENAKFVYSINALDSNVLELSVLDSDSNEIAKKTFDLTKSDDTLANEIEAVYEEIGYFVPVGFYSVTWNATDKVKERILEPGEEWIIEQYDSTVKLDYVQAHHYFGGDSYVYFRFFGAYEPTARATFTVNNGENSTYDVDKYTYDKGYSSTLINMSAQYFNDEKGQFESMRASNELRPGDIICYTESYRNGNNAEISDIPFRQVMNSTQCVLAPCEKNTKLADGGYEKVTVQGKEYYLLEPTDLVQKLTGIWLGIDDNLYYTEEINIGQLESKDGKTKGGETVITWYDKTAAAFSNSETYHFRYQFYTYVLDPVREGYRPDSYCSFYANNYKSSKYSARLYYTINARYNGEVIAKNMVTNPEKFGTKEERINKDFRSSYIGIGESVTYRLEFMQFWTREYTLSQGMITDDLPNTSGSFEWKVGENVHVEYFLTNRVDTVDGSYGGDEYERFIPSDDNDFCTVKTKKARINDQGEEKDIDYLSWGEFKIPAGKVLYIYVTLDYPKDQTVWDDYVEKADTTIYNVFRWQTSKSVISHNIARPPRVFLKTGMLATAADPNGYLYANGDEVERTVTYYLVIYNHGKSDYYLNPVYFKIPEGFTLKNPPKWQGWNSVPDWNCYGVTVEDENPPVNNPQRIGVYVNAQVSEDKTEGVLKVRPSVDYKSRYDDRIGKYYLKPGEYVSIEMKFAVDTYLNTPDLADFPVAMPIDDSHHVGNICKVEGVDAHRSNDENANAGTPEFWESDEIAQSRGFKEPYPSDTGKWVASDLKLTRKEAKPGLIKSPPSNKLMSETVDSNGKTVLNIQPYDPQDGVAMEYPVQWETKLVNGGENALTDYRVKDTIQWPYCFDREVVLKSQYSAANDRSFKIDRFYKGADDDGNQILDRDRLKINNVEIQIAPDRATALDPDNIDIYSARIMGGKGRVYFYKEDTFGDGRDNETMELDFTGTREYGVAPQSYSNGKPVPATRTLSYWTKYDMSKSKVAPRTSYCNRMILQPQQPYTKGDVAEGIAIGKDGNPVTDSDVQPDGILSVAYVSVNSGQSTVAWMTVKENKSDGQQDDNLSDDIKDVLTRENKILLGDSRNTVTYTMNVMNHVGGDTDQGVVQNPDDRKYSLKDMVIINCLPRIGDRAPFDSRVPRDSDFAMSLAGEVKLFYEDKANSQQGNGSETQMERNLQPVSDEVYRILYSTKETMSATDWNLGGGSSWKNTKPDGWYTFDELESIGGIGKVRSIRIELHDPTTSFPSDESLRSQYRELMKSGRTIVAQYKANVSDSSEIDPGKCAWNSFGYRFNRFITANDETRIMEASSIRTGVQIPAIPILYQKLINFNKNPYVNEGDPQTFKFTIEKRSREQTSEDDTVTTIPAQVISFKVSVGTGKSSESQKLLDLEDAEIFDWKREDGDTRGFWEDGASYVVKQTENPEEFKFFSVTVNNQPTAEFIYNASYQPVIIYENQCIDWNGTLFKMDKESEGYDPINDADKVKLLPGALFALYTTDESQKINFDGLSGDKYIIYHENEELINKAAEVEVNFGGKDEPPTKLYLKDIDITGSKDSGMAGRINWIGLKDDTYYVRELVAPDGYYLNLNYLSITKAKSELIVYDVAGKELPESGGFGTMPIYAIGSILLLSGFVSVEIKRRKDRSDNN